jgi:hypothetical protein
MPIPTALLPALEAAFNYDTFRDSPIVKPWDVGAYPGTAAVRVDDRHGRADRETLERVAGEGRSPDLRLRRGLRAWRGRHGTDPALALGGLVTPKAPAPEKKWQRVPVAGTFYREGAFDSSSQSLKTFYDEYNRVINGERSANRLAKADVPHAKAFVSEHRGALAAATGADQGGEEGA